MVSVLFFSVYAVFIGSKKPVALYLAILIALSSVSGFLVGRLPDLLNLVDVFNYAFTILILFIFIHGFKGYRLVNIKEPSNLKSFKYILFFIILCLTISLLLNVHIVNKSIGYILSSGSSITTFKNEGEAAILIRQWVHPYLVRTANIFSPLGYIALGLHFYYLVKAKWKLTLVFFLLSLNIPLVGLHGLSRSTIVQYILMYALYYFYVYPAIGKKIKFKINIAALLVGLLISIAFYNITDSRFSSSSYYSIESTGLIQNKILYSIFDYFSQWNQNGIEVMGSFTLDKLWYGKSSLTLLDTALDLIGVENTKYIDIRKETLGSKASSFNGLVANLLYDFGHLFALIFSVFFFLIVRALGPKRGSIKLSNFIYFSVLVTVPVMFFTDNYLSVIMLNIAIVYTIVISFMLKLKLKLV